MRFTRLADWLAWQETLHPRKIELGLERVRKVLARLDLVRPAPLVITVGGTNGKGSVVRLLEEICLAAGYRAGAYTSPHLLRYTERIRIDGREIAEADLCRLFAEIDRARQRISLTYFEFGTLAALAAFQRARVDVALLEVGLGGRLDAVNVVDPDVSVVTSIGIDHVEWLGADREAIAREKAGIFRAGRPAICGDPEPPAALLRCASTCGARLLRVGHDFRWRREDATWTFAGPGLNLSGLPLPAASGDVQLGNAASALQALASSGMPELAEPAAIARGLGRMQLPGRIQRLPGAVEWVLDVAHNPQSARALVADLNRHAVRGRRLTVLGMLRDKDAEAVTAILAAETDAWYVGGLPGHRGQSGERLASRLRAGLPEAQAGVFATVADACHQARADARPGDRVLVTGSFLSVAQAMSRGL